MRSYSSAEPSHHSTRSGVVSAATSSTHSISFLFVVGRVAVGTVIAPVLDLLGLPALDLIS